MTTGAGATTVFFAPGVNATAFAFNLNSFAFAFSFDVGGFGFTAAVATVVVELSVFPAVPVAPA